jgi:hypothetical protein
MKAFLGAQNKREQPDRGECHWAVLGIETFGLHGKLDRRAFQTAASKPGVSYPRMNLPALLSVWLGRLSLSGRI